ncbi:MAG: helix-turn-helix transcriptional regulator [Chloroflexi bacterium]|nr:helix-turn-helix transcriptional regulator [Chloroflexota bacterium]
MAQTQALQALDADRAARLAEIFGALGDPTRLRLISALAEHDLCVGDLAGLLGMSLSAVSHQLALLWRLRVVRRRRAGRRVYYALDDEHILSLYQAGLSHIEHA